MDRRRLTGVVLTLGVPGVAHADDDDASQGQQCYFDVN
jgi:hypothetical protein